MRILIVNSINSGRTAPFITDQVEALQQAGVNCEFFTIQGKGIKGYLNNWRPLLAKIREFNPDIIHAHYGLSGLLANLQRRVPVATTYHGSDINNPKVYVFSRINMFLSAFNIFVSPKNVRKANLKRNFALIPCGVDLELFRGMDKQLARQQIGINDNDKLVLFAGHFGNAVKNPALAQAAVALLPNVKLMELKGYNRSEVAVMMNAVDACLLTSHTEGSPQFVKEAMACSCPIVSVDVGDVKEVIGNTKGCYLAERDAKAIAEALNKILEANSRTEGRQVITQKGLEQKQVVEKLMRVYRRVMSVEC